MICFSTAQAQVCRPSTVLIAWIGSLLLFYIVSIIIYRLLFHPLAKYPGPLLAKVTSWYDFYYITKGDRHLEIWRQHEIYGPIVRFRPNSLSFNTPNALQDIYGSRKANLVKADWYKFTHAATKGQANTHSIVDVEGHAIKRRVLSQAFSESALRSMEENIVHTVREWCASIAQTDKKLRQDGWSEAMNMATFANYLIFDIIGRLAFGTSFNLIHQEENRYVLHLMTQMMRFVYTAGYAPYSGLVRYMIGIKWLSDLIGGEVAHQQQKMVSFARGAIELRFKEEEDGKNNAHTGQSKRDIVHYLLHAKDPRTGKCFTRGELESESELLLLAGGDTTACVLSGCIFHLLHNPETLNRLTKDIRAQFDTAEDIRPSNPTLGSLPYLRACIDETMRMSPPALGPLLRKVQPGGAIIDGKFYPAGVEVAVTTYALHHREENFPDSFCFRPERWIVQTETGVSEGDVAAAQAAFAPFSIGTRGCIGKNLAYVELTTAVARLLWQFDIKLVQTELAREVKVAQGWGRRRKSDYQMADFFIAERDGPLVAFRDRTLGEKAVSDPVVL